MFSFSLTNDWVCSHQSGKKLQHCVALTVGFSSCFTHNVVHCFNSEPLGALNVFLLISKQSLGPIAYQLVNHLIRKLADCINVKIKEYSFINTEKGTLIPIESKKGKTWRLRGFVLQWQLLASLILVSLWIKRYLEKDVP